MDRVRVIGAGVIGLTTAVCLAEAGVDVEVVSDRRPDATTSAAAGAMWDPYLVEPADQVDRWSRVTLSVLRELSAETGSGVRLVEGTQQSRYPRELPSWTTVVGARPCLPGDLRRGYVTGWRYQAPLVDMPRFLDHLLRRLLRAGGHLRQHRYATINDSVDGAARVVVNCTGAGARSLVADPLVDAVRGQLVVVENPGIESFFCDDTPGAPLTYVYPHGDTVVLGGTAEPGTWDLEPDQEAARQILARCAAVEPLLAGARVIEHRVGLRPARPRIRLETEPYGDTAVVHNYGHGGAGLTVSWGCAREAAEHVRRALGLTP
ncbi:FAD-dependent oxidoreductase [Streptomyces sp. NPDC005494]|uniref:FAD-dependent oxidoreductase n=1 Tax=unclassified Streptomyces TaxID=2593676 RepID=UPI0036CA4BB1